MASVICHSLSRTRCVTGTILIKQRTGYPKYATTFQPSEWLAFMDGVQDKINVEEKNGRTCCMLLGTKIIKISVSNKVEK